MMPEHGGIFIRDVSKARERVMIVIGPKFDEPCEEGNVFSADWPFVAWPSKVSKNFKPICHSNGSLNGLEQVNISAGKDGSAISQGPNDGNSTSRGPKKFVVLEQSEEKLNEDVPNGIVPEGDLIKQNELSVDGFKSSWASLFGSSGSLIYTPPKVVRNKIVIVPPEEVIAQEVRVWHSRAKCHRNVESKVQWEEDMTIIPSKKHDLANVACKAMVLESFKQLRKRDLVSVKDHGKSLEVTTSNSFGSLLEVGEDDKFSNSWDYTCSYSNSGVGRIWVMWKRNHFSFATHVVDKLFITSTLIDLLSGVYVEILVESKSCVIPVFNHWVEEPFFIAVVSLVWVRHEGVLPLMILMRNFHHLKLALHRHFGRHIRRLREEVRNEKEAMDRAQREVEYNSRRLLDWRKPFFVISPRFDDWNLVIRILPSSIILSVLVLHAPISREKVRRVLFSMDSGKAPDPDGFSIGFFKGAWSVVGGDFCDALFHFFETCYLPQGVNAIDITLIPKRCGPEPSLYYESLFRKAYDSVNWDFLFCLLITISTPLRKGLRQDDPLSLFLLVMVMEVLSRMLNRPPYSFQIHQRCKKVKYGWVESATLQTDGPNRIEPPGKMGHVRIRRNRVRQVMHELGHADCTGPSTLRAFDQSRMWVMK
ncbi:reverse transcriptase [Cucumis melo var. makuwa]|uniref:Reverse transcriptase n=1 Tax=Cucumis melo var. makuwa TaxID=1194695 RepID=A0A5D3C552_CUCMM|nr:reverse transcriptase [Cucumis melo var. makuwa]